MCPSKNPRNQSPRFGLLMIFVDTMEVALKNWVSIKGFLLRISFKLVSRLDLKDFTKVSLTPTLTMTWRTGRTAKQFIFFSYRGMSLWLDGRGKEPSRIREAEEPSIPPKT